MFLFLDLDLINIHVKQILFVKKKTNLLYLTEILFLKNLIF